jgi:pimeloyl-ACP methyl ester carboxylesterase
MWGTKVAGVPQGFSELRFTTGDVTLNYVAGPDNGPALLLIPGQMESWQGYKRVLPRLSQRFRVFVPDLRGHGQSTWTPGHYAYNICGEDLRAFIREVIRQPVIVAGLSSGGVLAIWLAANAPDDILAVIAEDPPIFSSIWPRINEEKYLSHSFKTAVDVLGPDKPGERDVLEYLARVGAPAEGKAELMLIPPFILSALSFLYRLNRAIRPNSPYDTPFLSFSLRTGNKFLQEYDTDFSRATIEGDLSRNFDPEATLKRVKCPMLLLRARAIRHEFWGLLGAIDDSDLDRITALVDNLTVVQLSSGHAIHIVQPKRYIDELVAFVDGLSTQKPPAVRTAAPSLATR